MKPEQLKRLLQVATDNSPANTEKFPAEHKLNIALRNLAPLLLDLWEGTMREGHPDPEEDDCQICKALRALDAAEETKP